MSYFGCFYFFPYVLAAVDDMFNRSGGFRVRAGKRAGKFDGLNIDIGDKIGICGSIGKGVELPIKSSIELTGGKLGNLGGWITLVGV